jgi:hypothetical protein
MTPVQLEALLFAVSVSSLGCIMLAALGWLQLPNESPDQVEERGAVLLRSWLSPAQAEQWEFHRHFYVTGCDTNTCYRVRDGRMMNIDELDSRGNAIAQWCFAPEGHLAIGDVILAQKIALETMELEALAGANRYRRWVLP